MIAAQTKSELPKYGASTRLAAISTPSSTAPERNTAPSSPHVVARGAGARGTTTPRSAGARAGSLIPSAQPSPR